MSKEVYDIARREMRKYLAAVDAPDAGCLTALMESAFESAVIEALKLAEANCEAIAKENRRLSLKAAAVEMCCANWEMLNGRFVGASECIGAIKALYEDAANKVDEPDLMAALKAALAPKGRK